MTKYEALAIIISCISAFVSILAIRGHRKLQEESNQLQKATALLSKKQLEIINKNELESNKAKVKLDLIEYDNNDYRFYLTNISAPDAINVELKLILADKVKDPITKSEYKKMPVPKLAGGSSISLKAAMNLNSPTSYDALITWFNPDGSPDQYEAYVSL